MDDILKAYLDEWTLDDNSGQWSHIDGWWVDECGVLTKYEQGDETYKSTIEFITPNEAKLAAFLFEQWKYKPVKHPENCHCIFCD